ncbi:integrase arm-type DNA-binding domain-containing protein [Porphyrobacter sp. YT40]|uniref:tyrosine-type recombinase/integrase n=1 Tax=Porphyrobacter sp. YT40 TaxID=2547601 RepID=UPI0011449A97|nr:integrase arm-type DNA-binding domain-containing protein [Porphyrobacter sp. YT40]QDH33722.1 DUF4102 domain-containing protein [Porphyrobacter sp. YT40]
MALTALQIRAFSPGATAYKRADERGLYLEIFPNGSKLWRLKYYVGGKEKRIALGAWPEVSLQAARLERDELRLRIAKGEDPALTRKKNKATAKISAANTFESVAREYIENKMVGEGRAEATLLKARWFLDLLKPAIGHMPISDVDPQMMLAPLKKLEARGNRETAKKCRSFASRVFRYGAATGRCTTDPTAILKGALLTPQARHYAAILEPEKLGELLRAIDAFECYLSKSFPVRLMQVFADEDGNLRSEAMSDGEGNPVFCPRAIAARDALIEQLVAPIAKQARPVPASAAARGDGRRLIGRVPPCRWEVAQSRRAQG